ncbi:hypothetical protein SK128_020460 [Halocaridina rubra]|uniref:Aminopeptidase N n=1 Tax=Halocaridina rubra TaxID=373956 RepID=A0AAN8X3G9_HALRR
MIAIPDFSLGGMENWGLINYRESALLYDEAISSASNKQRVMQILAHELAHQWFGNLVTPVWWNDIWLNEGFASFVEYLGVDYAEPTWNMPDQAVTSDLHHVFGIDALETSHPINIDVSTPDQINEAFDSIAYNKGASIIRMMNHFLTETTFTKGITNYLNAFQYDSAVQDDLWEYLTNAGHADGVLPMEMTIKEVMDTWTLQMGFPVLTVTRDAEGTTATVTQERFLLVKNPNSTDTHDYKWWIPITFTSQNVQDFDTTFPSIWMSAAESEITINNLPDNNVWVIFNIQETGYYRVTYDNNNWDLIVQQLLDDNTLIHVANRAQIIDDALNIARAGILSYTTALSVNSYLGNETDYIPWKAATDNLSYLEQMFTRAAGYGSLRQYLLDLLVPLYNSVGFDDNLNDPHLEQYKRVLALTWTCELGYEDCIANSVALYHQWMANPTNTSIISPNLKSTVYCTAIADGGEVEWDFAWNQYLSSNVASERVVLLNAMGCSKEIWILQRYLDYAYTVDGPIKKQDADRVFSAVAQNDVGRDLAWDFMRNEWLLIGEISGTLMTLGDMVDTVSEEFNTPEQKKELELFKEEHSEDLGTATRAVDQAIERTANNIAWMENNYDVIVQWLADHGYSRE